MITKVDNNLIYDLGMHTGKDTEFYLSKGFRVIALEANPLMTESAQVKFSDQISSGQLVIVNKALWQHDGETISFFVNPIKDDWSSVKKGMAAKGGHEVNEIHVQSLTLSTLFEAYGVPHYIKCDIEGADELFCQQLLDDHRRPHFVSVEAISSTLLHNLSRAGYDLFQLLNQALNAALRPPNPPREGSYAEAQFNGHMSGLFGKELDPNKWLDVAEIESRYIAFRELSIKDSLLAHGWLDFHATTKAYINDSNI